MKTRSYYPALVMIFYFSLHGLYAQTNPFFMPGNEGDFLITIRNISQTSDNVLEFDIYLLDTDPMQSMQLATIQFGINFNTQILNGAAQTSTMTSIVPGSSQLPFNMQPNSVNSATNGRIVVAGRTAPGSGNGFIVPVTSPGLRIVTLRITNQLPFLAGTTPNFTFTPGTAIPAYATRVAIYQNGNYTQLPVIPGNNANITGNPVLGLSSNMLPFTYSVTGGGTYCQGEESIPVGLSYSQTGVLYELFKDGITTNLTLTGNSTPLSFGQQPDGVYTIFGTNETGTIQMTGNSNVSGVPKPLVTIIADQETYCHGAYATFTSNLSFSGQVSYQWFRNNLPVGSNSSTLTLWAVNYDNVLLRVTTSEGCSVLSNTINLKVFDNNAAVDILGYEPIQLIAGEEVTLETTTYNAGLNPTFEWFVNDVLQPVNDCQLTYTPGPADTVFVRMTPGDDVPCLYLDFYDSNNQLIFTCTGPPQAFDVWAETNTCGGEVFSFGLSDTETGVHYFILSEYEGSFSYTLYDFFGDGNAVEEYGVQGGDFYYLAVNACDSTWMNGHADLYPFDTRVKISVSDNNICSGEEVIFNADSYQPDSVICTYNWVINGYWDWNPMPGNFNFTPANGDIITAIMATPCQHDDLHFQDNNKIVMMVNDCPGITTTWNGSTGENWFDHNNWDNGIPDANTIAIIPGGMPDYPTLTTTAYCSSIIIEHGGSFIGGEFLNENSALVKCDFTDAEFHFLSSPVTPNPLFGEVFPLNQHTVYARKYWERTGDWVNQTGFDQVEKAIGYSMQLTTPNTAQFIGLLSGTNLSTYIEHYNKSGIADREGWNLLGNPFPSAIDWDLLPHSFIENAVYVWDGTQYISWNGTVGALENGIIPPMNGFFVKMTASYWKTFTIPAASRVHGNVPFYKENPSDLLVLSVSGEDYADKTFIHFNHDATTAFDPEYDARKLWGIEEAPQLFSYADGKELSINEQPFVPGQVIELGFTCGKSGNFLLNAKGLESFNNNVRIMLEDQKEGIFQNLSDNKQYSFSYLAGESEHRFKLHFTEMSSNSESAEINVYSVDKTLIVNNFTGLSGEIRIFDFTGRMILNSSIDSGNKSSFTIDAAAGTYLVKVITAKGVNSQKVVLI